MLPPPVFYSIAGVVFFLLAVFGLRYGHPVIAVILALFGFLSWALAGLFAASCNG